MSSFRQSFYVAALVFLLVPARLCVAISKRTFDKCTIESEPNKGKVIDVKVDTHISGSIEFVNGAIATLIASFDVWDSELPRLEIYGTKGTICIRDIDPVDGPNLFGGPVLVRDIDTYRWKGLPRRQPYSDWREIPVTHRFNDLSHRKNSRGIGLVDMAYAWSASERRALTERWIYIALKKGRAFCSPRRSVVSLISKADASAQRPSR
jgi:hypothetical protein